MKEKMERKKTSPLYWGAAVIVIIILIAIFFLFQFRVIGEKAEITEYSVTTTYTMQECASKSINILTGEEDCVTYWQKPYSIPGIYKELPYDAENVGYTINFKVHNKAGKHLDVIGVKVLFCDANDNELYSKLTSVYDIPNSYIKESSVTIYESETSYFNNIEKVRFEVIVD